VNTVTFHGLDIKPDGGVKCEAGIRVFRKSLEILKPRNTVGSLKVVQERRRRDAIKKE
jgi:hypothetical protein